MPNKRSKGETRLSISLPLKLKNEAMDKACRLDLDMSKYLRRLIREDLELYGASPQCLTGGQEDRSDAKQNTKTETTDE